MEQFYKKYLLKNIARMLYFLFVPNVFYVYWNSMENFELSDFLEKWKSCEDLWLEPQPYQIPKYPRSQRLTPTH